MRVFRAWLGPGGGGRTAGPQAVTDLASFAPVFDNASNAAHDFLHPLVIAQRRGNAVVLRQADARRSRNRAGGRHAMGARVLSSRVSCLLLSKNP